MQYLEREHFTVFLRSVVLIILPAFSMKECLVHAQSETDHSAEKTPLRSIGHFQAVLENQTYKQTTKWHLKPRLQLPKPEPERPGLKSALGHEAHGITLGQSFSHPNLPDRADVMIKREGAGRRLYVTMSSLG